MELLAWGMTNVGLRRERNEDAYLINLRRGFFFVADGMGGHAGGDLASRMAVEVIDRELSLAEDDEEGGPPVRDQIARALSMASAEIYRLSQEQVQCTGMGTTVTGLVRAGDHLILAHVGDSRAYRLRDGLVAQLTEDHSLVAEQLRYGLISEEEARTSRLRHIITRSVGIEPETEVDLRDLPVKEGDLFLLCTDGLGNVIDEDGLREMLCSHNFYDLPRALVGHANGRGGDDNVTVVIVYAASVDGA